MSAKAQIRIVGVYGPLACLCCLLLLSHRVVALMPPHVTETVPQAGGILQGDTVFIYGYTLTFANIGLTTVHDLTSNEHVPIATQISCVEEGEGDMAGAAQLYCTLMVKLNQLCPGHEYRLTLDPYLETTIHFTAVSIDRDADGLLDD